MKTFAVALLGFLLATHVAFGAKVSVDAATLSPGSGGIIAVSLTAQGDRVSGLQFDMAYDDSALSINAVAGTATRSAGKNVYYADLSPTTHRVLLVGLNRNLFNDGPVFTLFTNVSANAPPGAYAVTVTNVEGVDPDGNPVPLSDATGVVTVAGHIGDISPVQSGGILNAASLLPGAVSPGELIAVIGSTIGPATPAFLQVVGGNTVSTVLANTQVKFDGLAAPLIYAGLNQVNAIVPYELSGQTTNLTIVQSGKLTSPIALPVAAATPAIFTQNSSGTGQAAALNQDGSLNTPLSVAPAGSIIAVYLTGAGQANPLQVTGRINGASDIGSTLLEVKATIAGLPAEIKYAGPAPGLVAGATQVNLRIPAGVAPSLAAPISIQIGSAFTQSDVVVSVGFGAP